MKLWFDFGYTSGGRWAEGFVAARATGKPKFIDGLGTVYLIPDEGRGDSVFEDPNAHVRVVVFNDVNMVEFDDSPASYEYAKWLVAELNSRSSQ